MYRGAMIPGLLLAGSYIVYVVIIAFLRPGKAPALPEEARIYKESNGGRGLPSLAVLSLIAASAAYFGGQYYFARHASIPVDERVVVTMGIWGIDRKRTRLNSSHKCA